MATISETELQRRLRSLENRPQGSESNFVSDTDPVDGSFTEGDTHYNASTSNLFIFEGGSWGISKTQLHIKYATNVVLGTPDVVEGFSTTPYDQSGFLKPWRGFWWGDEVASGTATDYEWFEVLGTTVDPSIERRYTTVVGTLADIGTPTKTGAGVEWEPWTDPLPAGATWAAERFLVSELWSSWAVYPLIASDNGIPFLSYTKTGYTQPVLGSDQWVSDVLLAATSATGRTFSSQKELGYGTVCVITYDDGKLAGQYALVAGSDVWIAPSQLIDGDLVVDGTIVGDKLQANTITATQVSAGAITADEIASETITADQIAAEAINASKILIDDNISFSNSSSGIIFNKTSLTDGTHGAFYGRGTGPAGESVAGFAISSPTSSILMDSLGTFRLIGVDIFTGAPGVPVEYAATGTFYYNLGVPTESLDIELIGSGGGGSTNAAGDRPAANKVNGSAGSAATVTFYDGANGTGTILGGYSAAGGAGAVWSVRSNVLDAVGAAGEASSKAAGGFGGPIPPGVNDASYPGNGSYGSGGGSGGANGSNGSADAGTYNGGRAGETLNITSIPAGTMSIKVFVPTGGLGGVPGGTLPETGTITSGGNGGNGFVSITNALGGGTQIDLDSLGDAWFKDPASWNTVSASINLSTAAATRASFGTTAGWYACKGYSQLAGEGTVYTHFEDTSGGTRTTNSVSFLYFSGQPSCIGTVYTTAGGNTWYLRPAFKWHKL